MAGESLATTGGGVELVEETQALVVLCKSKALVPVINLVSAAVALFPVLFARIPVLGDDCVTQDVDLAVTALEAVVLCPGL